MFIDAFQIVLLYLYGESPIAVDMFLNLTTTNPTETTELLSNLLPAVFFVIIIYVGGMVLAVLNPEILSASVRKMQRKVAYGIIAAGVLLLGVSYMVDERFRVEDDVFPVNSCYNLALSIPRASLTIDYSKNVTFFSYHATSTHPDSIPEVYVLIIGETARADNFGIYGYQRPTTPLLSAMGSDLATYFDAITMSNTTHKSVPLLMTPVGSEEDFDGVYYKKGIITAFKEAGFSTAFYSCQHRNHSIIDFLGSEAHDVRFL